MTSVKYDPLISFFKLLFIGPIFGGSVLQVHLNSKLTTYGLTLWLGPTQLAAASTLYSVCVVRIMSTPYLHKHEAAS